MLHLEMTFTSIATFCADLLLSWIFMVTTAYLADVLVSSLLRGMKFGGLLAFILFVILNVVLSNAIGAIHITGSYVTQILVNSGLTVAASFLMYLATARIMETKLSV